MASTQLQQYQSGAQTQVRVSNHSNHLRHPFISAYDFINTGRIDRPLPLIGNFDGRLKIA